MGLNVPQLGLALTIGFWLSEFTFVASLAEFQ